MNSSLISIVTPTRNRCDVLLRSVQTVLAQTITDFEHIIVDDASSDGTKETIEALADPRLRYIRFPEQRGANAARNAGIEYSRSPIITFLDSDDAFLPKRLEHTLSHFRSRHNLSLMISSFILHGARGGASTVNGDVFLSPSALESALIIEAFSLGTSAITARRKVMLEAGSFDPKIRRFQDRDLLLRLSRREGAFVSAKIDWVKYPSRDSISRQRPGYVQSYGDLALAHREVIQRYPDVAPFLVGRRILNNTLQGRPLQALSDYRENQAHPALGYSGMHLVRTYINGRRLRARIRNEFH